MITSAETPRNYCNSKAEDHQDEQRSTGFGLGTYTSPPLPLSAPAYAGLLQEAITYAPEDISAVTCQSHREFGTRACATRYRDRKNYKIAPLKQRSCLICPFCGLSPETPTP